MRTAVVCKAERGAEKHCSLLVSSTTSLELKLSRAVGAHAATPSSLAGETFTSDMVRGSTLTGTCAGSGVNPSKGSFDFSVSGTAAGPFPGTFTESGRFTTSPSGIVYSPNLSGARATPPSPKRASSRGAATAGVAEATAPRR